MNSKALLRCIIGVWVAGGVSGFMRLFYEMGEDRPGTIVQDITGVGLKIAAGLPLQGTGRRSPVLRVGIFANTSNYSDIPCP